MHTVVYVIREGLGRVRNLHPNATILSRTSSESRLASDDASPGKVEIMFRGHPASDANNHSRLERTQLRQAARQFTSWTGPVQTSGSVHTTNGDRSISVDGRYRMVFASGLKR